MMLYSKYLNRCCSRRPRSTKWIFQLVYVYLTVFMMSTRLSVCLARYKEAENLVRKVLVGQGQSTQTSVRTESSVDKVVIFTGLVWFPFTFYHLSYFISQEICTVSRNLPFPRRVHMILDGLLINHHKIGQLTCN